MKKLTHGNVEVTDTTGTGIVSRLQRFAELTTLKQVQDRVRWTGLPSREFRSKVAERSVIVLRL